MYSNDQKISDREEVKAFIETLTEEEIKQVKSFVDGIRFAKSLVAKSKDETSEAIA